MYTIRLCLDRSVVLQATVFLFGLCAKRWFTSVVRRAFYFLVCCFGFVFQDTMYMLLLFQLK